MIINKSYFFLLIVFLFFSCGEDRTSEYEQKTNRNHWLLNIMKEYYLWPESINEDNLNWKDYFSSTADFLKKITKDDDTWSWCSIDTIEEDYHQRGYFNHINSYGLDFVIFSDPTRATSRQFARVTNVIKNSPAEKCGLKRGDFIGYIDGVKFSSSVADKLVNGKSHSLVVYKLSINEDATEFIWKSEETIQINKSEYVEDIPIPISRIFSVDDKQVAYLMCNRLTSGPEEKNTDSKEYLTSLDQNIHFLKSYNPTIIILDFRLCNYGNIEMANKLASYMLSPTFSSDIFAKIIYNEKRSNENKIIYYDKDALANALGVTDVFCITSEQTQGAAEWVIRALSASLGSDHVYVIGTTTSGQTVITEPIKSDYCATLYPVVAYVADKNDNYNYFSGIIPDYEINDVNSVELFPYGDTNEVVLSFILDEIANFF